MNKRLPVFIFSLAIAVSLIPFQSSKAEDLSSKLKGRILLQVESKGEAWYVNPKDSKRYYMANGSEAYNIMRNLGVGVTNNNLEKIKTNKAFAKKNSGKIFLQVESKGEAYYIDVNGVAHYLKDGEAAYGVMRELGLGIKTADLNKISASATNNVNSTDSTNSTNTTDSSGDININKSINEVVKLATLDVKVNSAGRSNDISGALGTKTADANTKFIQFNLEVTNTTNNGFTFLPDVFELVDGKGRVYSPLEDSILYLYNYLSMRTLAPGIKETGNIVFKLPLDSFDYKLRVRKMGTNEVYLINIPASSVYDKNGGVEKVDSVSSTTSVSSTSDYANRVAEINKEYDKTVADILSKYNTNVAYASKVIDDISLSGYGQKATDSFSLDSGLSVITLNHTGSSNFIVKLYDSNGDYVSSLANEIGQYNGEIAIGIKTSGSYRLSVIADGSWGVKIKQPRNISGSSIPTTISGYGNKVNYISTLDGGLMKFDATHSGTSNFIVKVLDNNGQLVKTMINEIGSYSGSTLYKLSGGVYVVPVIADGSWSINITK